MWRLPINHSRETTLALPFELTVGLRYTRAGRRGRRKDGFMSFISGISVASIAVGVMALIIVLSVMNGFQKEVRDRMLSVLSHAEIYNLAGGVGDWNQAPLKKPTSASLRVRRLFRVRRFFRPVPPYKGRSCAASTRRPNPQ